MQTEPLLYEAYVRTGQLVQVFRHFPLDIHPNAPAASEASICAGDQDPQLFWALHDWLFQNQGVWEGAQDVETLFRNQAVTLGADAAAYDACIANPATAAKVQSDMAEGAALGVRATPTFFVYQMENGQPVGEARPLSGALPFAQFSQVIDEVLAQ